LRRHAEELPRFSAAGGSGGWFILREKLSLFFVKPGGIRCVFSKSIKHERILSHGWAQVNLPKLYCHDFVTLRGQETQAAVRFKADDASL
jgi:hypothetical protein